MKIYDKVKRGAAIALLSATLIPVQAQRIGLKTNALYWAAASPNIGAEFRLNRHVTLNMEGVANRLKVGSKVDTRLWSFSPEVRYWFSARPQAGHFLGLMGTTSTYNLMLGDTRHNGDAIGGGLTYGYSFVLGRRWSLEATLGGGMVKIREKKTAKNAPEPGKANNIKWMAAPLKAGVTFVYIIR